MLSSKKKGYRLSAETVDHLSREFAASLTEAEADRKDIIRLRLSLEEILESWVSVLPNAPVVFCAKKRMGKQTVEVRVEGKEIQSDDMLANCSLSSRLLAQAGLTLTRSYQNGENCLTVYLPRKQKLGQMQKLLLAIVSAVCLGLLQRLLPASVQAGVRAVTDPLFTLILNLLRAISSPMIFLAICSGIFNIGDMTVMGKIGKKVIGRIAALSFLISTATTGCLAWFFPVELSAGGAAMSGFSTIYQIVLDIVPADIVSPFLNGNTLQIIFLGAAAGVALLVLGERASAVRTFVEQVNEVVQFLMEAIGNLIPLFVFFSLFGLLGSDFGSELTGIFKAIALTYAVCPLMCLVFIGILSVRYGVRFRTLLQKLLPTFLIGLTTASSSAAFATNLETCEKKLGIPQTLVHFAVPLGQVLYMPGVVVAFVSICLCMAENYGVAITPAWLVTMAVVTGLLSLAMPPIPGGALTCYAVMFAQLGIPSEALALAVAVNSAIDFIATACNLTCLQIEAVTVSGKLGMLDRECLKSEGTECATARSKG